jgi:antitoxin component YwqK of YwqJK toxin-antitoxin module
MEEWFEYVMEKENLKNQLKEAEKMLVECDPEKGRAILASINEKGFFIQRIFTGPAEVSSEDYECWGWLEKEYNDLDGKYYEYEVDPNYQPDADTKLIQEAFNLGIDALQNCEIGKTLKMLSKIERILMLDRKGRCLDRKVAEGLFRDLKSQIDTIIREGLCEKGTKEGRDPSTSGCSTIVPKEAKHYEEPKLEYWKMRNGKYVGPYRTWYDKEKTKPHVFGCYNKDGERHGKWTRWNEKPWVRTHVDKYEDGKRKSLERYDNEERPTTKETYENGKLSEWIEYKVYGNESRERIRAKGTFKEGTHQIETGTVTEYFIKSGKPKKYEKYKGGKKHGEWKTWYEEPYYREKSYSKYNEDKRDGFFKTWSSDGIPTSADFYKNDELKKRTIYSKGKAIEVLEY